uniref:Uncharacterized protein n=1 Tax=Rhizophora mucronata TaxID=61149 RepID=A0A2P2Q421_RHIMU
MNKHSGNWLQRSAQGSTGPWGNSFTLHAEENRHFSFWYFLAFMYYP